MRLIEYDSVAGGEQLGQPFVAKHDIRKKKMMVDDHYIRQERLLAGLHDKAVLVTGAFRAQAILASRSDLLPDGGIFRHFTEAAFVTGFTGTRIALNQLQVFDLVASDQAGTLILHHAFQMIMANIIGPAFEQRHGDWRLQRSPHGRDIAVEKLILQGFGSGRDDDLATCEQGRHQVRKGLACPSAGLSDENGVCRDGVGYCLGHFVLLCAHGIAGDVERERAIGRENRADVRHQVIREGSP